MVLRLEILVTAVMTCYVPCSVTFSTLYHMPSYRDSSLVPFLFVDVLKTTPASLVEDLMLVIR